MWKEFLKKVDESLPKEEKRGGAAAKKTSSGLSNDADAMRRAQIAEL